MRPILRVDSRPISCSAPSDLASVPAPDPNCSRQQKRFARSKTDRKAQIRADPVTCGRRRTGRKDGGPTRRRGVQLPVAPEMNHLRQPILYPPPGHPHHMNPPSMVASSNSSNPAPRRRATSGSATGGAGSTFMQGFLHDLMNPSVFFNQDPEIEPPAASVSCYRNLLFLLLELVRFQIHCCRVCYISCVIGCVRSIRAVVSIWVVCSKRTLCRVAPNCLKKLHKLLPDNSV